MVRLKERSQRTKSSFCETLYENIFRHYSPCQFKKFKLQLKLYRYYTAYHSGRWTEKKIGLNTK